MNRDEWRRLNITQDPAQREKDQKRLRELHRQFQKKNGEVTESVEEQADEIRNALKNAAKVIAWHDEKRVALNKETAVILSKLVALNNKHPAEFFERCIERYKEVVSKEKVSK